MKKCFCLSKEIRLFRKINVFALCLVFVAGLFAGCGGDKAPKTDLQAVRVGSLKGPTTLGLLAMIKEQEEAALPDSGNVKYEFQMMTAADELLPMMIKGQLDIALLPANVASVLYGKMDGNLRVIDINTMGVLYMVSGNEEIDDLKDLENQTIYLTGKGTTPDYVLRYLLSLAEVDMSTVTLEFKSEATEVAAVLAERPEAVGLLPQPFVTVALAQNDRLDVVLDLTRQWELLCDLEGSKLVTGVTVVRKEFLEQYPEAVEQFLKDHAESAEYVNANVDQAAVWAVQQGIIAKEPLAKKAIPQCNIVCIQGQEMKKALSGYLQAIYGQSQEAVGGQLPRDDFYYVE